MDEVLVAFTPEHFLHYAVANSAWFSCTDVPMVEAIYLAITAKTMSKVEIHSLPEERARMVKTIYVRVRDSPSSQRVLKAYRYQCAITGLQLKLPIAPIFCRLPLVSRTMKFPTASPCPPTRHTVMDDRLINLAYDIATNCT